MAPQAMVMKANGKIFPAKTGPVPSINRVSGGMCRVGRSTMIPEPIIRRKKQPYRSPDALCFVTADAPAYVPELLSEDALGHAGVFDTGRVRRLYEKCIRQAQGGATEGVFSNTDNMSFVGILSTQLLYDQFVRNTPTGAETVEFKTLVDRAGLLTNSTT